MSTTNIQPLPSVRGRMRYTELGEGQKYKSNIEHGTNRIAAQMGDMESREEFTLHCEAMRRQNPQRANEGFEVRVSWAPDEMDISKPEDVQRAMEYGYLLCKEIAPESACWVTVHTDGEGGCLHVHATICNHDEATGKALSHGMDHRRVAAINDRLSIENGFSVVGKPAFVKDKQTTWFDRRKECTPFEQKLGDAVQYASVISKDEDEFKRTLKRQGVDVKETKGGWSYYMMDETGGKRRKRRRKASNLADDLTKDSIEERFREKQAERETFQTPQNATESRFEPSDDKAPASGQKTPYEAPREPQRRPMFLDTYHVDEGDIRANLGAAQRQSRQNDPLGEKTWAQDVRKANPEDITARLQAEVDKRRDEFHRSQQALQDMGRVQDSSFRMLNRMFAQMSRSMDEPADRMIADMMAQMMAMLWQMEQERIERERREALEQDLYEKRGAMWDAEKRLKAANNAIRREDNRSVDTQHRQTPSVKEMQEEAQGQYGE